MSESHTAYILHRRPYRETSLLVELLTADSGRVGAVARGGRRPRKGAPPLEPFRPLRVTWSGRGELRSLRGVEAEGTGPALGGEPLYLGLYLNELLVRLCPRFDPCPRLFPAYADALTRLAEGEHDVALRRFEAVLLEERGLGPDWGRCAGCRAEVRRGGQYRWVPERGVLCPACAGGAGAYAGEAVRFLAGDEPPAGEAGRRQARDLMRAALAPHLGPRPLESRELLRSLRRGRA